VNGFVLAGGRSTRMGKDKTLLTYAGRPLVEHATCLLRASGFTPFIIGHRPDLEIYAPVTADLHPGCGPLGGIETALAATESEWNIIISVDAPLVPPVFLRYLAERAAITKAPATVPTLAGRIHPLCAVYSKSLLPVIRQAIQMRDYKVQNIIQNHPDIDVFSLETVAATRDDWPRMPPLHRWLQNLNTPGDMALVS
jgi:molybdenum cofactor guanylyltransferase